VSQQPASVTTAAIVAPGDPTRSLTSVLADPGFRAWQDGWRRRITASRRLLPIDGGWTTDPLAPSGRWAC